MLVEFWHRDFMFDFVCHQMVLGQYQDPRQVTAREKVQSYRLISLLYYRALLYYILWVLCFLQTLDLWHPCIRQVYGHHFFNSICSLPFSGSHFGNSCNISNFIIIIIIITLYLLWWSVISDLWCYKGKKIYMNRKIMTHWSLRWWQAFLRKKVFSNEGNYIF